MNDDQSPALSPVELKQLASHPTAPCSCTLKSCAGWESVSNDRWPAESMRQVGTLRQPLPDGETEPTFEEFHPHGTRYESPQAPIAVTYFPFNRCDVYTCQRCSCAVLKYTEFGGYYIDHRARRVDAELIAPLAST